MLSFLENTCSDLAIQILDYIIKETNCRGKLVGGSVAISFEDICSGNKLTKVTNCPLPERLYASVLRRPPYLFKSTVRAALINLKKAHKVSCSFCTATGQEYFSYNTEAENKKLTDHPAAKTVQGELESILASYAQKNKQVH